MKVFSGINDKLGIDMGSSQIRIYSDKRVILEEAVSNGILGMGVWWIMK